MTIENQEIRLAHGGGGSLTQKLLEEIFLPSFDNRTLNLLEDSAVVETPSSKLAFTTDSFVVHPLFFPGGDIGRLAVCGTVNDLAVMGAVPLYLSVGFIIEEGFKLSDLKKIVSSMKISAEEANVKIVTGDTKVVERGSADGLFINTSGVGQLTEDFCPSSTKICVGDQIVVSGLLGKHGMAIITAREDFGFTTTIQSDVAPLNHLVKDMMGVTKKIHAMRDATRGGVATVLNEMALQSKIAIKLEETKLPIGEDVRGGCELLGFDPLYMANEGVLVAFVESQEAENLLDVMKRNKLGKASEIIGKVMDGPAGRVTIRTVLGSHRIVDKLSGEQLPRIC